MRTIDATLSANQATLSGRPAFSLVIGTAPTTVGLTDRLIAYHYEEHAEIPGQHYIILDNSDQTLSSLTGDYSPVKHGARVELKRGLTIAGVDKLEELPATWIEAIDYRYAYGRSTLVLHCIDAWGKLQRHRIIGDDDWTNWAASSVMEDILDYVGLTRAAGTMTTMLINFKVTRYETLLSALQRLMRLMPEYYHFGLDGEIKWQQLLPDDNNDYTFGWNANHPLVGFHVSKDAAYRYNTIRVTGTGAYTGTANDATEVTNVGTRRLTIHDTSLQSDAQCTAAATAILRYYGTRSTEHRIYCKPCHGIELYDVITVASPPWGGANLAGRPIAIAEDYDYIAGTYLQTITLGYPGPTFSTIGPYQPPPSEDRSAGRSAFLLDASQLTNIDPAAMMPFAASALTGRTGPLTVDGLLEVVGSPGQITAGGGAVVIDEDGVGIAAASSVYVPENDPTHSVHWLDSGPSTPLDVGYIYTETDAHATDPRGVINLLPRDGATEDGYVYVLSDLKVGKEVRFLEDLVSIKTDTSYTVYGLHLLDTPLTSTSFDGDAFSDTSKTKIDLSSTHGVPAGIAAGLFYCRLRDSNSTGVDCWLLLSPDDTSATGIGFNPGHENDFWSRASGTVPCDGSGDVYYQIEASGASTFDVHLRVWGYHI